MIELCHVTKQFGRRLAVEDLTLSVSRGEIYGLLGHNGAGKSTAIGIMLGQVWPTRGEVVISGHSVSRDRTRALRKVGAIFEAPAFYPYLSGRRNLEILSDYTAPTPPGRILDVLGWVGLADRARSKVRTYSHGMKVRLALAQALLPDPELLILDEPGDGLDPEGIHEMRHTILRLHRELQLTILLSSHFLTEVEQICTRIAVLHQGRKVFEGPIEAAKRRQKWIRLRASDFSKAAHLLREARLANDDRQGELISLAEGVDTAGVVRHLVQHGISVHEIAPEQETLESFYLSLMETERRRGAPPGPSPSPRHTTTPADGQGRGNPGI